MHTGSLGRNYTRVPLEDITHGFPWKTLDTCSLGRNSLHTGFRGNFQRMGYRGRNFVPTGETPYSNANWEQPSCQRVLLEVTYKPQILLGENYCPPDPRKTASAYSLPTKNVISYLGRNCLPITNLKRTELYFFLP